MVLPKEKWERDEKNEWEKEREKTNNRFKQMKGASERWAQCRERKKKHRKKDNI